MKRKQVLALLLAVAMTANMTMPAFAATAPVSGSIFWGSEETAAITEDDLAAAMAAAVKGTDEETEGAEKEETVYVFTDANGKQKSMTVSNWLKNKDGADKLYDNSILQNIENVKGDESFTQNGDILTWNAGGNDIYYQGTTDKTAPITQQITYYLDGKEIAPEDLAGKSGKVKIHIDYDNSEKYSDVFVPFTTMTGIIFSNDNVKNVEVDNGSVISEGKNTVVVGMAFPGLSDSLQSAKDDAEHLLDETEASQKSKDRVRDLEIPDSVEITMDATDFKMSTCMTMVFSGLFDDDEELEEDHDSMLKDMDEKIADLEKDGADLADGAGKLSDGIDEATDGSKELADGAGELASGIKEYTDGVSQVNDGADQLADGTDTLVKQLPELTKGLKAYTDGVSSLDTGAGQLQSGVKNYTKGVDDINTGAGQLKQGTDTLTKSLPAFSQGLGDYVDGVKGINSAIGQIADQMPELKKGSSSISVGLGQAGEGMNELAGGINTLKSGTEKLAGGSDTLHTAAKDLAKGAVELQSGIAQYTEGVSLLGEDTKQLLDPEKGIPALYTGAVNLAGETDSLAGAVSEAPGKITGSAETITVAMSDAQEAIVKINSAKDSIGTLAEDAGKVSGRAAEAKAVVDGSVSEKVTAIRDETAPVDSDAARTAGADYGMGQVEAVDIDIEAARESVRSTVLASLPEELGDYEYRESIAEDAADKAIEKLDLESLEVDANTKIQDAAEYAAEKTAESINTANDKLGNISNSAASLVTDLDSVSGNLGTVSDDAGKVAGRIGEVDTAVRDLSDDLGSVSTTVGTITEEAGNIAGVSGEITQKTETIKAIAGNLRDGIGSVKSGVEQVDAGLGDLAGKSKDLNGGAEKLSKGLSNEDLDNPGFVQALLAYVDGVKSIDDAVGGLRDGAVTLNNGIASLAKVAKALDEGAGNLADGAKNLKAGSEDLAGGSEALMNGAAALAEGASSLGDGVNNLAAGTAALSANSEAINKGVSDLKSGTAQLAGNNKMIISGAAALASGASDLNDGMNKLASGTQTLANNSGKLSDGAAQLSEGAAKLADGMSEISSGALELKDGCIKLNEEGVQKLAKLYKTDVKSIENRIDTLKDAAKSYKTFSGTANPDKTRVKFIYKTDSIEKKD